MDGGPPLRGADPVNGELEVGFDSGFEHRWAKAEIVGRIVMALVVAATLAGLFGRGPYSHRSATAPGGLLAADYEPVARFGTETQVTLHLPDAGAEAGGPVHVFVNQAFIDPWPCS